ncbi:MAG TPA: hypothetical protein VFZ29_00870 [Solirubrobacterales bacterium]
MKRLPIVLLCAAALVAGVLAAPAEGKEPPYFAHRLELEPSNGFHIGLSAFSEALGIPAELTIGVETKRSAALYKVPAKVTETTIQADLDPFGRVDLVMRGSGRVRTIPIRCSRGQKYPYETGVWEGMVEFRGEGGYVNGRETSLPVLPFITSYCGGGSGRGESRGGEGSGARLKGTSFAHGRFLSFQVNKNHARGKALFDAELKERRGGVRIYRFASGWLPASAFRYDPDLRNATLSPPAPFSGLASLRRRPDSVPPLWSGDLAIEFPGRKVSLAGPGTHVSLIHACFQLFDKPEAHSC